MDLRKQFEKEQQTKIVDDSSLQDYIEWLEKNIVKKERSLRLAKSVIKNYQSEIRNSEWVGVDLVNKGFCQGEVYRDAIKNIDEIIKKE